MDETAVCLMIEKLNKLSPDIVTQIEIVNQSIVNGWQGIFPLKEEAANAKPRMKNTNFNNFNQRNYDYGELERQLLNRDPMPVEHQDP